MPKQQRRSVLRAAAEAVAPGGTLLVVGHDLENLTSGHGGPQDPAVLYRPTDIVADIEPAQLVIVRQETAPRRTHQEPGVSRSFHRASARRLVIRSLSLRINQEEHQYV